MRIRPFELADAPAVASLWQYWFRTKTLEPDPHLVTLARRLYGEHPDAAEGISSLVAEDDEARMLGFLGVTVTPILLDDAPAAMAGVFPSVVAPTPAAGPVASLLLRRFLAGPQAFTFSDGGHVKFERIWELLGGRIAALQSLRWIKLLRPCSLALDVVTGRARRRLRRAMAPFASAGDWLVRGVAPGRLRSRPASTRPLPRGRQRLASEELTPAGALRACERLHRGLRMRPRYTEASLRWRFDEMRRITSQGRFTARLLLDPVGDAAGWYVAYLQPGGLSRVFVLEALPRFYGDVIDDLFVRADDAKASAVLGRLSPALRRPMAERGCFIENGGSLQMLHSHDASLLDAVELGRTGLNRLDGENWYWWGIVGGEGAAAAGATTRAVSGVSVAR